MLCAETDMGSTNILHEQNAKNMAIIDSLHALGQTISDAMSVTPLPLKNEPGITYVCEVVHPMI